MSDLEHLMHEGNLVGKAAVEAISDMPYSEDERVRIAFSSAMHLLLVIKDVISPNDMCEMYMAMGKALLGEHMIEMHSEAEFEAMMEAADEDTSFH